MSEEKPCRHEYVKIYQRRLKGLERRLVATKAYLPVGFKMTDFGHLSEGSYCFCSNCRARLFPRRTAAEKAAARQALLAAKAEAAEAAELADVAESSELSEATDDMAVEPETSLAVEVEELVLEMVDVQDIESEGVKLADDDEAQDELNDQE